MDPYVKEVLREYYFANATRKFHDLRRCPQALPVPVWNYLMCYDEHERAVKKFNNSRLALHEYLTELFSNVINQPSAGYPGASGR